MLRVSIDIVPFGDETLVRRLTTLEIANDATNLDPTYADYKARLVVDGEPETWIEKLVVGFNRSRGHRELVREVLEELALRRTWESH